MAKKPIHLQASGALTQRERIWAQVRRRRKFTAADIEDATRIPITTIRTYLEGLAAAGYIAGAGGGKRAAQGLFARMEWRLVKDCGIEAPRVNRSGVETHGGRALTQMWRSMRCLGQFDYRCLAHAASTEASPVTWGHARYYVSWLAKAGYLGVVAPARGRNPALYALDPGRYTGPKAPQIQRLKRVWDPNLGKVIDGEAWK